MVFMGEFRRVRVDGVARTVEVVDGRFEWFDGRRISVEEAVHLPPVQPTKVACVHLNYRSRLEELGRDQPPAPITGTPAHSRPVEPGSVVAVEVEGLGRLENEIVSGELGIPADFGAQPSDSEAVRSVALGSDFRARG
jgi:2-keto-4-pentenoate hydratase/2-oxohepta-3-ene-1,7-dioic acid hydratase in catechol pathway